MASRLKEQAVPRTQARKAIVEPQNLVGTREKDVLITLRSDNRPQSGIPLSSVAAAEGWKDTVKRCYQQADAEIIWRVVLGGAELREVR